MRAVSQCAGFMPRFKDLTEIVVGKNDCVLLLRRMLSQIPDVDQVSAQRQLRPVLFDDPERQDTNALRLLESLHEITRCQFLPFHGQLLSKQTCGK